MKWYEILKAARRLSQMSKPITAESLVEEARIAPGENSTPSKIASGWLSKFRRWGYVLPVRKERTGERGRPRTIYLLTPWGKNYRPEKS